MRTELILTTRKNGTITEKRLRFVNIDSETDTRALLEKMAARRFGSGSFFLRKDPTLYGLVAVDALSRDTLHLV